MDIGRIITGVILILIGIVLILIPFFVSSKVSFVSWIYGIPILIIGIFILCNKKENDIELIKSGRKNK